MPSLDSRDHRSPRPSATPTSTTRARIAPILPLVGLDTVRLGFPWSQLRRLAALRRGGPTRSPGPRLRRIHVFPEDDPRIPVLRWHRRRTHPCCLLPRTSPVRTTASFAQRRSTSSDRRRSAGSQEHCQRPRQALRCTAGNIARRLRNSASAFPGRLRCNNNHEHERDHRCQAGSQFHSPASLSPT